MKLTMRYTILAAAFFDTITVLASPLGSKAAAAAQQETALIMNAAGIKPANKRTLKLTSVQYHQEDVIHRSGGDTRRGHLPDFHKDEDVSFTNCVFGVDHQIAACLGRGTHAHDDKPDMKVSVVKLPGG